MDLLSIFQAIWRHKIAATPVILLTALGALYVLAVKPPVYQASSNLLLVNPPPPPTEAQIAADPKLAKVNANNPYDTLGDLWTADALVSRVASDWPQAQIGLSADPDNPPIIQITGSGSTPQAAIEVAEMATDAAVTDLYQMQKSQGVNDHYMLKGVELVQLQAKLSVSGKLRSLIAVLGIGLILLFVVVSAAQAVERLRRDGRIGPGRPAWARLGETAGPDGDAAWAPGSTAPGARLWGDDATGATPGTATARSGRRTPGDYAELRARTGFCPAPTRVAAHWHRRIQRWRNHRGWTMALAVITPSYRNDWSLFVQMHQSVLLHTQESVKHYVIVPGPDVPLYSQLAGPRCVVIPEESLYPRHYRPVPALNRMLKLLPSVPSSARIAALNLKRPLHPIRGWIMQQAVKMEACRRVDADVLLLLDSDVVLIRQVTASTVSQEGRVRFYRRPGAVDARLPRHTQWHAASRQLLGLRAARLPAPDYVSSFMVWDQRVLRALLARIERVTGQPWMDAVTKQRTFSEWTLYGVFVDEIMSDAVGPGSDSSLCHSYWAPVPLTPEGAAELVASTGPDDVAILIQSKSRTPIAVRRAALQSFDSAGPASVHYLSPQGR